MHQGKHAPRKEACTRESMHQLVYNVKNGSNLEQAMSYPRLNYEARQLYSQEAAALCLPVQHPDEGICRSCSAVPRQPQRFPALKVLQIWLNACHLLLCPIIQDRDSLITKKIRQGIPASNCIISCQHAVLVRGKAIGATSKFCFVVNQDCARTMCTHPAPFTSQKYPCLQRPALIESWVVNVTCLRAVLFEEAAINRLKSWLSMKRPSKL